jgi:hypothetical protein
MMHFEERLLSHKCGALHITDGSTPPCGLRCILRPGR